MFGSAGCSLLRAEGFSSSMAVLYGGLEISKLQFLFKNIYKKFSAVKCFTFWSAKVKTLDQELNSDPDTDRDQQLEKMLNPDTDRDQQLEKC
jgi:hypothetical protein